MDKYEARKKKLQEKLDKLSHEEKLVKEKMRRIQAKANSENRKKETRAKIILGGFMISHYKKNEKQFKLLVDQAIHEASERDQKLLTEFVYHLGDKQ